MNKTFKRMIIGNITNVLTLTFNQFNASLLNKSSNLNKGKIFLTQVFWMVMYDHFQEKKKKKRKAN